MQKPSCILQAQESDRAPPLTANLAEKRAAAMAKFINTVRRNKPPVVTVEGLTQASSAGLSEWKQVLSKFSGASDQSNSSNDQVPFSCFCVSPILGGEYVFH